MQFDSYEFILMLLPATLICYFIANLIGVTARKIVICISGLVVYAFGGISGLIVFAASIVVNFLLSEIMLETAKLKKLVLVITIVLNILVLLVFKYSDFAITNINIYLGKNFSPFNLVLPLGISFFTLQQIAYVINVYKGNIKKVKLFDYLTYILYFPKIFMGPITDPVDLLKQINDPAISKWNWENFVSGIKLFSFGLFKKLVLADTFAAAVTWSYSNAAAATSADWIVIMLASTFEIYFNFSGYTDMAIGVSKMLNIDLPMNFDSPYKAVSVKDFWSRWNISLTKFLSTYIYIPLKGKLRKYIIVLVIAMISGLWYGANWTFVLWGFIFGLLIVFDGITEKITKKFTSRIIKVVRWLLTFIVVNFLWLLFSSESVDEWIHELIQIFSMKDFSFTPGLVSCFRVAEAPFLENIFHIGSINLFTSGIGWMIVFMVIGLVICLLPKNNYRNMKKNSFVYMILAAAAFAWSFIYL